MDTRLIFIIISVAFSSVIAEYSEDDVFITKPEHQLAYEGNSTKLNCTANASLSVNKCRWMWKPDEDSGEEIQVEEFQAYGNQSNDCTAIISNVTHHQHGVWICVILLNNKTVYRSTPAKLTVETPKSSENTKFMQSPQNVTLAEGEALPLPCITEDNIFNCYWLIKLPDEEDMLPIATFKPANHNNCSMVLPNADKKHTGQWVCGVKMTEHNLELVYSKPAFIFVNENIMELDEENGTEIQLSEEHEITNKEENVTFAEKPVDAIFVVGSNGSIQCITLKPVQKCRWFWQPQGYSDEWQVLMKEFPPEDERDCSLQFKDVTTEPEGLWLCAVLPVDSETYYQTKPVTLRIKTLIEFSVLTRAVVVAEGMETSLRCQTEADVQECRWRWHQLGEANAPSTVVTTFPPFGPSKQDCSIQFTNMLMEQQGVWVCGVKLTNEDDFKEAMPTTVSLKPAGRVRIIDISQPITIAEKEYLLLTCITSASIDDCSWEWTPTNTSLSVEVIHFPPDTKDSRNCSLKIDHVEMKHDGLWKCSVEAKREKGAVRASTDPIKITVIKPVAVSFKNVANVIHASPGSNHQLDCHVLGEVSMCRWKFLGKPDVIKAEFPPVNGTDCSLNLNDLKILNSGYWQCGVKSIGQYHYVYSPLTTLNVLHTENVTTSYWISETTNQLSLACHLETNLPKSIMSCHWFRPTKTNSTYIINDQTRYKEYFDESNGDCILEFHSHESDPGMWQCLYSVDTENGTWKLGEAKFVVISNPHNLRLRLIVGILAAIAVIMAIVLAIAIVYGCPWTATHAKDKLGKTNCRGVPSTSRPPSKQSVRYTEEPGKINFHFQETPKLFVDLSLSASTPPNHVYERVGQYVSPTANPSS